MELLKEQIRNSETKYKDSTIVYTEGDVIVPDVKPDILKILQVDAVSLISSKEIADGFIKVSGVIKYYVLYIPEKEGECIKSITTEMPFSHTIDKKNISENDFSDISSDVERVEFTLLNSRKLNLKTAIVLSYTVWENKDMFLASGIDYEKAEVICEKINVRNLNVMEEHTFTVRDRLEIPSGRASISEILKMDINIADREIKAITGKAVIKGNVSVCVLYVDTNGDINSIDGEIPFTEIAEIFDLEEDASCDVGYRLGDFTYECGMDDDGEPRTVDFDISVAALISSWEETEAEIMKDCFCPGCKTEMIYDTVNMENIFVSGTNQFTIKEIISQDKKMPQISTVYNVVTRPIVSKVTPSKGRILVEGKLEVYVLYITDSREIPVYSFKKEIPLSFSVENERAEEALTCTADIICEHITFNMNMASEVELRCILSVNTKLSRKEDIEVISGCTLSEGEKECAIVIYYAQPGDTLWQIAKRYSVPVSDIVKFNNLQDRNVIEEGERLIIPFC